MTIKYCRRLELLSGNDLVVEIKSSVPRETQEVYDLIYPILSDYVIEKMRVSGYDLNSRNKFSP